MESDQSSSANSFDSGASSEVSVANTDQEYSPKPFTRNQKDKIGDANENKTQEQTEELQSLQKTKTSLFSPRLYENRKRVLLRFLLTNGVLCTFIMTIFVLFWGTTYNATGYYHKVRILAVIQDDIVDSSLPVVPMTSYLQSSINEVPGQWHVYNTSTFQEKYNVTTVEEINEKVQSLIYDEKFFVSLNVQPNVTRTLFDSLTNNKSTSLFNSSSCFQSTYESGRDPINIIGFIVPLITELETYFQQYYSSQYLPQFLNNITIETPLNYTKLSYASQMKFDYLDYRPFYDRILYGPAQVGPIYTMTLTVFLFMIYGSVHARMAQILKPNNAIFFRWFLNCLTCFLVSLFICTVSAIFQVDFTRAFGKAGFIIYWMTTWLYMFAVAGIHENVISIIFSYRRYFTGMWILGFTMLNIAPTIFSMALDDTFYRYGYAMPMHNAIDIYRVIFMDLSRYKLGRNYGILVAYVVINAILNPFILRFVRKVVERREAALKN
ncbi:hypothetical protein KAFR_0C06253 [Kazachstania africana CBS 2517]|uniref:DUF3533 domain-containing protein n=1 Tax=Kazachstania africana (strain ATCC 22294 / BCRC 22015 / CBS 2517 / CECT 1963 / NBRC 1671 / NRRL Y-8276) TaxID=1071382 RepID=H2ATB8_KAZAF|nr:hypothetical protein KAFR_0C06253 [Kazachstania africana CBS 2517]CCF57618.1 hypothetical protein KAFR_0C06253 [Kazachstania africana CBS 2517]